MNQSEQINELAVALSKAQAVLEGAEKSAQNPHLKNRYADLGSVWDAIRKPMADNGLSVVQCLLETEPADGDSILLRTVLMHTSGQWIESVLRMPFAGSKATNAAQAAGSAITYARRYALSSMLGVCPADDDASSAGEPGTRPAKREPSKPPARTQRVQEILAEAAKCSLVEELGNLMDRVAQMGLSEDEKRQLRPPMKQIHDRLAEERETMQAAPEDIPF